MCIAADLKNYAVGRPYYTHVLRAINEMSIFLHYDGMYCMYMYKIQAVRHSVPHRRYISACIQCTVRTATYAYSGFIIYYKIQKLVNKAIAQALQLNV